MKKKKDEKVWGTFLTRFRGTVKVMRIKWIKSQKVQEVLLSEEELLKDKKTFFFRIYLLGESIDSYMTDLRNKAARCDLGQ